MINKAFIHKTIKDVKNALNSWLWIILSFVFHWVVLNGCIIIYMGLSLNNIGVALLQSIPYFVKIIRQFIHKVENRFNYCIRNICKKVRYIISFPIIYHLGTKNRFCPSFPTANFDCPSIAHKLLEFVSRLRPFGDWCVFVYIYIHYEHIRELSDTLLIDL